MSNQEFQFIPPPEAPVFKPTWEEFQDALGYINKIRPIAEQSGICKVIPPPDWQPPFAVDVDNFKFTPRIQRLNELEAHTRIKLNFLDQIAKFWELQGSSLKIPVVERKALDLYTLHKNVLSEGGVEMATRDRKWNKIAAQMGYPPAKNLGALLKSHHERILQPYEIFNKGKSMPVKKEEEDEQGVGEHDYKPHKIPIRMAGKIPDSEKNGRRSRRHPDAGADSKDDAKACTTDEEDLAKYICLNCGRGDAEDQMLLCDGCDDSYHTFCLIPSLPDIPKGDWRCPKCIAVECSKPMDAFGFEQAQKEYTLQSFGEMADKFKQDYFNMPVHLVPTDMAEREFWRIVSSIDEDVTVEYGADLHTMDHGSGFPTVSSKNLLAADQEYAVGSWNLNNLPVLEGSVLAHINCDISGMKVPWMYVGMCFSTFCWHNEDHWSYSINYLHWGEPKTWYGVPGSEAEVFENTMKKAASELFNAQPDLLHQLVTIMNPNILMKSSVPIVRTNQHAGEFVITFPRSYHAGFNQGYNFAEAVNFAPSDWLPIGRECVMHYSNLKRYCVFSHDELVCKMATTPDDLDLTVAAATYQDLLKMVDQEKKYRKQILQMGVTNAEREAFELLPDDERQCEYCKTTCFLSAVVCSCKPDRLACIRHSKLLCDCPPENYVLRYRYTLDELPPLLLRLKERAESFDNWAIKVKNGLEAKQDDKLELCEIRELVEEAEAQRFPDSELLQTLVQAVTEAEKCATVAAHLATKKVRTRTRGIGEAKSRLTLEELRLFYEQIESLACVIKEGEAVKDLLTKVTDFQLEATEVLNSDMPDSETISKLLDTGCSLDIDLPELPKLKHKLLQVEWLEEVEATIEDPECLTVDCCKKLLECGITLPPDPQIERSMAELQELLSKMEMFEEKASQALNNKPGITLEAGEELLKQADEIQALLPSVISLREAVKKARTWVNNVNLLEQGSPTLEAAEALVARGKPILLQLEQLARLEEGCAATHTWLDKTSRIFLKKNSYFSLLEVLVPRTDIGMVSGKRKRVKKEELSPQQQQAQLLDISIEETSQSKKVVSAFKECEERELGAMRALRSHNKSKRDCDSSIYCICHKPAGPNMITCSLCEDLFHPTCVPSSSKSKIKISGECRFLCPSCERSRRPRLETILSLLVSLQKLSIRPAEADALQCLTERSMSWQDRTRQLLLNDELKTALGKLSVFSQKLADANVKSRVSSNNIGSSGNSADEKMDDDSANEDILSDGGMNKDDSLNNSEGNKDPLKKFEEGSWEHAYSTNRNSNKDNKKSEIDKVKWNQIVSNLVDSESPLITLSPAVKTLVLDRIVEGELLEVSMDELSHLWRVWQAAKHPPALLEDTLNSLTPGGGTSDEKNRKHFPKKRKSQADQNVEGEPKSPCKSPKKTKGLKTFIPNLEKLNNNKGGILKKKCLDKKIKKEHINPTGINSNNIKDLNKKKKDTTKKKMKKSTANRTSDDDEDGAADEACAATRCLHPVGQNVDWVQCDGCELWFHYACVGLNSGDIVADEDYLCIKCTGGRPHAKVRIDPNEISEGVTDTSLQQDLSWILKDSGTQPFNLGTS